MPSPEISDADSSDGGKLRVFPSLPKINLLPKRQPGQPSTWQKLNDGTKAFFSKTLNKLSFVKKEAVEQPAPTKVTGTQRIYSASQRSEQQAPDKPVLFPWLKPKQQKQPPERVNDWLRQPRVPFH